MTTTFIWHLLKVGMVGKNQKLNEKTVVHCASYHTVFGKRLQAKSRAMREKTKNDRISSVKKVLICHYFLFVLYSFIEEKNLF